MKIDSKRLWNTLMEMAKIGATRKGGCNRQALTDEDCRLLRIPPQNVPANCSR